MHYSKRLKKISEDDLQNYLVLQPLSRCFTKTTGTNGFLFGKLVI